MGEIFYSQAITFYGIPIFYIVTLVLIILFILYLLCRMKRKPRHSMKKSSYVRLFIALFILLFIYNLYFIYNSSHNLFSIPFNDFIIVSIFLSLVESIFPYLFITLSILIINYFRK